MSPEVIAKLIENIIFGFPNFFGFILLAFLQWRIIQAQHRMLERVITDYLERLKS